ncbi:MAG: hypothetical protein ACT4QF_05035 [Sporichthyaceae bacterium]
MTTPPPPRPVDGPAAALAGLARETEALRRRMDDLATVRTQVADLADVVADLAERLIVQGGPGPGPTTWLDFPDKASDPTAPRRAPAVLGDLLAWTQKVFLRYPDGATALPECWPWHPDVVEELLWLRAAWAAAYRGPSASVLQAGDWHDRCRPGVVRRIRAAAGTCSPENHRPGQSTAAASPPPHVIEAAAAWWTTDRDAPAPAVEPGQPA